MRREAPSEKPRPWLPRLLVSACLAAGTVLAVIAVAAYALMDTPLDGATGPAVAPSAPASQALVEPLDQPGQDAALRALAVVVAACVDESRRLDPAVDDRVTLSFRAEGRAGRGSFSGLELAPSLSPFLRGCLTRELPRASFPAPSEGAAWLRARLGKAGVEEAAAAPLVASP